jgi:arginase family enzyme
MIDLNDYLVPVSIDNKPDFEHFSRQAGFPHNIAIHTDNNPLKSINKYKVAIIGIPEGRNSPNYGSAKGPDAIREQLYRLSRIPGKTGIIDLGNMKEGITFNDTVAGLTDILKLLITADVLPVMIGGSSATVIAADRCFSSIKHPYTLATVDSRIDFNNERKETDSFNYLNTIIHSNTIDHFINIGYQTFLNDQQVINRFLKRKYDLVRVGEARLGINNTEPLFRDSDAAIFDISAVRQSDAPATVSPSPNGFYGEEICLLARYAGISDRLKVFGLFEVNPDLDIRNQTSGLAAQILWFFLEGFTQKQFESPALSNSKSGQFIKYHVRVKDVDDDLIFVKSNLTDRWWMELPAENKVNQYIACSYEDYLKANRNEVPDKWLKAVSRQKP